MAEIATLLDAAHAAVSAEPENEALRLRFFERLADGELVLLLEREAVGERLEPKLFELEDGPVILVFDREERLAEFSGGIAPDAALPGRVVAAMLKGQGIGLGVNLGVAPSSMLLSPEAVDWLWDGWLAAGKLQILGGQPGTGKTTIATALAATVTIGGRWPDGSRAEAGSVVIWSGEDDPADTLVPRLRAAGADMTRVHFIDGMRDGADRYPFDPARDSDSLLEALAGIGDVRLLVIDPIVSAVAGDSHKNAEVRRSLQPLVDLAQRQRCALLGVTHFTKGTAGREPVERITGSLAFGALARLVMVTAKAEAKDGEPARRFLARAKSNIGPDGGGFVYDLQQGELPGFPGVAASSVLWGAALEGTARELLADAEQQDDEAGEQRDAADWLRDVLGYGPMPVKDVKRQADECGFAWRSVQRAMRRAGVESRRGGFGQPATWRLASCATSGTVAPVAPNNLCGANGANGGVEDTDAGRGVMEL